SVDGGNGDTRCRRTRTTIQSAVHTLDELRNINHSAPVGESLADSRRLQTQRDIDADDQIGDVHHPGALAISNARRRRYRPHSEGNDHGHRDNAVAVALPMPSDGCGWAHLRACIIWT